MILPWLLAGSVLALRSAGRLAEARDCADEAAALASLTGNRQQHAVACAMQCWIAAVTGGRELAEHAAAATATLHDIGTSGWTASLAARMLGETMLAAGNPDGCLALAEPGSGAWLSDADPWSRVGWYELLTRAELAAGRAEQAAGWAGRAETAAARLALTGRTGLALLARAQVRVAQDPAGALRPASAAARALAAAGMALDRERARLAVAHALAARGDVDGASAELRHAQRTFEALGAGLLTQQAVAGRRQLAGQARGARAGAARRGPEALTRRERQIGRLVTEGLTNRQIARQVDIAEKTVEMHLSNIFTKLGASSRAGVASLLSRTPWL
jgi:DNA-binding NarL/FixJ family response regulator